MALDLKNPQKVTELKNQRSLVIIKPDGVVRHLVGEILNRFERKGLKIVAMKMLHATKSQIEEHYKAEESWYESNGNRTYEGYVKLGQTPPGTPRELAENVHRKLVSYLGAGPAVYLVLEGAHVIEIVRKMRGATSPLNAEVGTVGFDFTLESYELGDAGDWAIRNILHGSDAPEAAAREIPIWFKEDEIMQYKTAVEDFIYSDAWHQEPKAD
jgi:nucleoside-diphosphate kinase